MAIKGLFIGVNEYGENLETLAYAETDATAMLDKFKKVCSIEAKPLLGAKATKDAIEDYLEKLEQDTPFDTREKNILIFYFAGHGAVLDREYYLYPSDADTSKKNSLLLLADCVKKWEISNYNQVLVILDACRNELDDGSNRGGQLCAGVDLESALNKPTDRNISSASKKDFVLDIIHGCKNGQTCKEYRRFQHGLFSYSILKVLTSLLHKGEEISADNIANKTNDFMRDEIRGKGLPPQTVHRSVIPSEDGIILREATNRKSVGKVFWMVLGVCVVAGGGGLFLFPKNREPAVPSVVTIIQQLTPDSCTTRLGSRLEMLRSEINSGKISRRKGDLGKYINRYFQVCTPNKNAVFNISIGDIGVEEGWYLPAQTDGGLIVSADGKKTVSGEEFLNSIGKMIAEGDKKICLAEPKQLFTQLIRIEKFGKVHVSNTFWENTVSQYKKTCGNKVSLYKDVAIDSTEAGSNVFYYPDTKNSGTFVDMRGKDITSGKIFYDEWRNRMKNGAFCKSNIRSLIEVFNDLDGRGEIFLPKNFFADFIGKYEKVCK